MDILYHYCPTPSFSAIVSTRSIWLSSLTLANDSMEGKLVKSALTRLAERDGLDNNALERLQQGATHLETIFDGLGFCLSEEKDLLSQWRGYANDGTGVSIGFSRAYLVRLSLSLREAKTVGFTLRKVEYSPEGQEVQVEPTYRDIRKLIDAGAFKNSGMRGLLDSRTDEQIAEEAKEIQTKHQALYFNLLALSDKLYALKMNAFREEREWRLISFSISDDSDDCLFRERKNSVIPYRTFELPLDLGQPIVEVLLGPKHQTPPDVIARFLKHKGFGEVVVRRSEATYR